MGIGLPFASRPLAQFTFTKGAAGEKLSRGPVQNVKEAIAIAPKHQLARASVPIHIGENRNLHRVIIIGSFGVN